jgi:hypothetical protein
MTASDVRIIDAQVRFEHVPFAKPLWLSSGPVDGLTEARVKVRARRGDGREASGEGSVLLSYPWAGGSDSAMRTAVSELVQACCALEPGDPFEHGATLLDRAAALPGPTLSAQVALGPVDQAIHDAWARAAGASAFRMYTAEHLNSDLGAYLGPDFAGHWPGEWLARDPKRVLPVQAVLGVHEPSHLVTGREWVKVKLTGNATSDITRVQELEEHGVHLSLDSNEAYQSASDLERLLKAVHAEYIEQPVPRAAPGPGQLPIPALADEGLPDARSLDSLTGWAGIVVKTCRGQTAALLAYCWARFRQRLVVQQDLTNVGLALAHAAVFAGHCEYSWPAFECNSLKYAPAGNAELAHKRPGLVRVHNGNVEVSASGVGIR